MRAAHRALFGSDHAVLASVLALMAVGDEGAHQRQGCRQQHTRGMIHSYEDIVAFLPVEETLQIGSVSGCGTIGGCHGLEGGHWLQPNDLVEVEFERLGVLRNRGPRK